MYVEVYKNYSLDGGSIPPSSTTNHSPSVQVRGAATNYIINIEKWECPEPWNHSSGFRAWPEWSDWFRGFIIFICTMFTFSVVK